MDFFANLDAFRDNLLGYYTSLRFLDAFCRHLA